MSFLIGLTEIILSFLAIAFIYALDEAYLIDEVAFKRLKLYGSWDMHFRINPLKAGLPVLILTHSFLLGIVAYLSFSIVEDLIYQCIKKFRGLPFNWGEYVKTVYGVPKYYIVNSIVALIVLLLYIRFGL